MRRCSPAAIPSRGDVCCLDAEPLSQLMMRGIALAAPTAVLAIFESARGSVMVSNVVPRTDSDGAYMDAHDGNTIQYTPGGPYFW
eukprot:SAG31_NODE_561_length_14087_cov_5.151405_5_plen_85_part_00